MGYSPTPPTPEAAPDIADCNREPAAPPASDPGTSTESTTPLLDLDLTGLVSRLSNISVNADLGLTLPPVNVDLDGGVSGDACANDASGGISIDVGTSTGAGGSGLPLVSLDSDTEATIQVPLLGDDGILSGGTSLGGLIGGEGDGTPLISLDSETDAAIQVPVFGENGLVGAGISGSGDFGSLLSAAMLDVGNVGSLSSIIGGDVYDGNVPLAGDLSSALGSTLDLLTTTSSLFDVPALDILGCDGLDG